MLNSMLNYLREVRGEFRHVNWPTHRQTIIYTVVVLIVTLGTAAYLGALDYLFTAFVQHIL